MWFRIVAVCYTQHRGTCSFRSRHKTGLHHQPRCPTYTLKYTQPPHTIRCGVLLTRPQISATVVSRSRLSVRCLAWVLRCQIAPRATHPLGPFTPTVTSIERSKQYIQLCWHYKSAFNLIRLTRAQAGSRPCARYESLWGSGSTCIAQHIHFGILDRVKWWALHPDLLPAENDVHWIGTWVNSRSDLRVLEKTKSTS
jgi:hypothetical protein